MAREPVDVFTPRHKFQDDVWGQINVNDLERDVIDTPEFQRLFRTSQLGFVDLVYQTANHTRGAHSIGACHVANLLMDHLDENCKDVNDNKNDGDRKSCVRLPVPISRAERTLIRLGGLLHDISHVPLSHDIERKTHKIGDFIKVPSHYGHYEKHDDYEHNPLLYRLLCSTDISVLARVLRSYSQPFYRLLTVYNDGKKPPSHLERFLGILGNLTPNNWNPEQELLPALLFHMLFHEDPDPKEADKWQPDIARTYEVQAEPWGLGPPNSPQDQLELHRWWYQPFRHDIIGNTLSADLIDYLRRDCQRLGMDRHIDLHLLNYYVLVRWDGGHKLNENKVDPLAERPQRYRCAINLHDSKRNTSRIVLVNDIFRLLDLRHEIHEKAVMHRVVQSANAMLSRALLLLGNLKPKLKDLACLGEPAHALQGEDAFFRALFDTCVPKPEKQEEIPPPMLPRVQDAYRIIRKLIERRVYRPLLIVPGDRAADRFSSFNRGDEDCPKMNLIEYKLRTLATIVDAPYYSPFLLFVSASVEKYLQGLFGTRDDLCRHVQSVIANAGLLDKAMAVVPSRVVIWTTPYKQLYKDPALVVALQDWLGQIDELKRGAGNGAEGDPLLAGLVEASIAAADGKYAALWKLYVFISDGLFYSGVINKLLGLSKSTRAWHWHKERLKDCQVLLMRALDKLGDDWAYFCRDKKGQDATKKERLNGRMEASHFHEIVEGWIKSFSTTEEATQDELCEFCGIDIDHYVHAWDASRKEVHSNCRDIPYKFDNASEATWTEAKAKRPGDRERDLVDFLEGPLEAKPETLTDREFRDLVDSFDGQAQVTLRAMQEAGADKGSFLKQFFWGDFPREPLALPEAKERTKHTAAAVALTGPGDKPASRARTAIVVDLPQTKDDFKRWLLREARFLKPHVKKQVTTNMEPIATFVMEHVEESMRAEVLVDIRDRLDNEARKIFNHVKADSVMKALTRRWPRERQLTKPD